MNKNGHLPKGLFSLGQICATPGALETLPDDTKIWIITEADRSVTTFLLPSEY